MCPRRFVPHDHHAPVPMPGLVWLSDDDVIVAAEQAARDVLGAVDASLVGQSLRQLLAAHGFGPQQDESLRRLLAGEPVELDWATKPPEPTRTIRLSLHGSGLGQRCMLAEEVTWWRQKCELLSEAQARLEQLEASSLRAITIAPLVHDLNNLLTEMVGEISLGLNEAFDRDAQEALQRIQPLAGRATRLLRRLLRPRPDMDQAGSYCELNNVTRELAPVLHWALGERSVLELALSNQPCPVALDADSVERILLNLVINARDAFHTDGGQVTIRTERLADDATRLTVADTGHGMPDDVAERALEPLFTTKVGGTGIGLASVDRLVSQAGGRITLQTAEGRGTTVHIELPHSLARRARG